MYTLIDLFSALSSFLAYIYEKDAKLEPNLTLSVIF